MFDIPTKGFGVSDKKHNVELDCMCDWIEGCITFSADTLSLSEIVDSLCENGIYRSQDFAKEHVTNAFTELSRRAACLGHGAPYVVHSTRLARLHQWEDVPAFAFCLMLSLQVLYRDDFLRTFGSDYTEQGLLFERLTVASLERLGWATHSTAWSKHASQTIRDRVEALATHLGEPSRPEAIGRWTEDHVKDGGLDVVCHLGFADRWSGRPLLCVQCASGENWKEKRATPNLELWEKLLDVATRPRRGISIPFALLADDFRRAANYDRLYLVLDRHRVCAPTSDVEANWLPDALADDLNAWTKSRIQVLPLADVATTS
jgi:hypothetical protein